MLPEEARQNAISFKNIEHEKDLEEIQKLTEEEYLQMFSIIVKW